VSSRPSKQPRQPTRLSSSASSSASSCCHTAPTYRHPAPSNSSCSYQRTCALRHASQMPQGSEIPPLRLPRRPQVPPAVRRVQTAAHGIGGDQVADVEALTRALSHPPLPTLGTSTSTCKHSVVSYLFIILNVHFSTIRHLDTLPPASPFCCVLYNQPQAAEDVVWPAVVPIVRVRRDSHHAGAAILCAQLKVSIALILCVESKQLPE